MVLRFFGRAALICTAFFGTAARAQGAPPVAATKKDDAGMLGGRWYGTAEMRHHLNTYYDDLGRYQRQEPTLQVRLQAGARFYDGAVDAYTTLGVYKMAQTQQVLQRRPELGLDFHLLKNEYFDIIQYNLMQLPYRQTVVDPETQEGGEMGTVALLGFSPSAKLPLAGLGAKWELKAGTDGWTKVFSRKQYTGITHDDDELDEGHLALAEGEGTEAPIEDTSMHYRLVATAGITGAPAALPQLVSEISGNHYTKFDPRYTRDEPEGPVSVDYGAERISYYRWRLQYQVSDRWSITNDFYEFFAGMFEARRTGLADRRFRNVARVSCKL